MPKLTWFNHTTIPWEEMEVAWSNTTRVVVMPVPPSGNAAYRTGNGIVYSSHEWYEYQRQFAMAWRKRKLHLIPGLKIQPPQKVAMHFTWYRPRRQGDIGNRMKTAEDALQGYVYVNDSQLVEKYANLVEVPKDAKSYVRVEVTPTDLTFLPGGRTGERASARDWGALVGHRSGAGGLRQQQAQLPDAGGLGEPEEEEEP